MSTTEQQSPQAAGRFATTHWSLVIAAGRTPSPESREALAALCEAYWHPLYVYVRCRGYEPAEAQDLTQSFFVRLLEKDALQQVDRARGRFRSFLLASMKNFLANQWDRETAVKRGGGNPVLSFDVATAEDRFSIEPANELTPERIFEKRWGLTLLAQALAALEDEYRMPAEKHRQFERLKGYLTGESGDSYQQAGEALGMSAGAVKTAVHRLRRRFRDLLRLEIGRTVADPADVDDEIRNLFAALGAA